MDMENMVMAEEEKEDQKECQAMVFIEVILVIKAASVMAEEAVGKDHLEIIILEEQETGKMVIEEVVDVLIIQMIHQVLINHLNSETLGIIQVEIENGVISAVIVEVRAIIFQEAIQIAEVEAGVTMILVEEILITLVEEGVIIVKEVITPQIRP